ncbi:hypothetical protein ILUMI_12646 [Ignelater luminosus]|uniref:Cytochrome P450 n=1 Tax=Ignelater luminosus TaxID=2038154 RepID=A0A8K0G6K9_IGNLU|nr:hypothetical protein ILUMI_12646 [Ignelater luminosus]
MYERPWPVFGNLIPFVFKKQSLVDLHNEIYKKDKYNESRYIGLYHSQTPVLLIKDAHLIREMMVENFEIFPERTVFVPRELDRIWAKSLFALPAKDEWKGIKTVITSLFTGSRLRNIFDSTRPCVTQLGDYITTKIEGDKAILDTADIFSKVSNDIIAKITLGILCNSLEDPQNRIYTLAKDICNITGLRKSLKFFLASMSMKLAKFLKISFIKRTTADFMGEIIRETINIQGEEGSDEVNLISFMMNARAGQLNRSGEEPGSPGSASDISNVEFTDDIIIAQTIVFFFGGLETLSRAISYAAYELAIHPDVQEKLRSEIDIALEECGGNLDYDKLVSIKYLDMVVTEALRLWPPIAIIDRRTTKKFMIRDPIDVRNDIEIDEQVVCLVPVYSIHRDPARFPNPERFHPERFEREEARFKRYTYMPFGVGRRACVGGRFALIMMKMVLVHILSKFEIVPVEETPIPLVLSRWITSSKTVADAPPGRPYTNTRKPDPYEFLQLQMKQENSAKREKNKT